MAGDWFGPKGTPSGTGYFAIGYEPWHSSDFPMWYCNEASPGGLKEVVFEAVQFVQEGVEIAGVKAARWADIYYVDDVGKVDAEVFLRIKTETR